jgi:hypothetical protein
MNHRHTRRNFLGKMGSFAGAGAGVPGSGAGAVGASVGPVATVLGAGLEPPHPSRSTLINTPEVLMGQGFIPDCAL